MQHHVNLFIYFPLDVHSEGGCHVHVGDAGFYILHHKIS